MKTSPQNRNATDYDNGLISATLDYVFGGVSKTRSRVNSFGPVLFVALLVGSAFPAFSPYVQKAEAAECKVAVAGDIAKASGGAEQTAKLVESLAPNAVITTGDNAYESGTAAEFKNYYEPTWGRFKDITYPSPGNHEYNSGGKDYLAYFGVEPYYSFNICGWHAVSLNSEIGLDEQLTWLKSDLQANAGKPLMAFWHSPRFSSSRHGSSESMQPLWEAVTKAGAQFVFTGHDHVYERFAPMDASGTATENGTTNFVIGTGGAPNYEFSSAAKNSEKRINDITGVGLFTLGPSNWNFQFMQSDGTVGDQGSGNLTAAQGAAAGATAPAAQTPVAQTPAAQTPAGAQAPTAQMPATQTPVAQVPTAQVPAAQAPVAQTPTAQAPGTASATPGASSGADPPMGSDSVPIIEIVPDDPVATTTTTTAAPTASKPPGTTKPTGSSTAKPDSGTKPNSPSDVGTATWKDEKFPSSTPSEKAKGTLTDVSEKESKAEDTTTTTSTTTTTAAPEAHTGGDHPSGEHIDGTMPTPVPAGAAPPQLAFTGVSDVKVLLFMANSLMGVGFGALWLRKRREELLESTWV